MYIIVNSLKRNLGFKGVEVNDILIGFPILFSFIILFAFTPFKIASIVFLMIGCFMLLPVNVSKKNRMYKIIILIFQYLLRNKTYIFTRDIIQKSKVMRFAFKK